MQYVRLYSGPEGESHFEDVAVALDPVDFAPPAPPLHLSAFLPVARLGFLGAPPGWRGDWHPTPRRQFLVFLSGGSGVQASDGEIRHFKAGDVLLVEDTTGKGHLSWAEADEDILHVVIQAPD